MSEFVPKMIGLQDVENHEKIKSLYEDLINRANTLWVTTQNLFQDPELEPDILYEMLKKNEAELVLFLKHEFIRRNKIEYPGLSVEKLISLDLISLPKEYDTIVINWKAMNEGIETVGKCKFEYPLRLLFDPNKCIFELDESFESDLSELTSCYTTTEKQNEVLDIIERFCNVVNDMIESKIIRNDGNSWAFVGETISQAIVAKRPSTRPLSPDRRMFKNHFIFERFGDKAPFQAYHQDRNKVVF